MLGIIYKASVQERPLTKSEIWFLEELFIAGDCDFCPLDGGGCTARLGWLGDDRRRITAYVEFYQTNFDEVFEKVKEVRELVGKEAETC